MGCILKGLGTLALIFGVSWAVLWGVSKIVTLPFNVPGISAPTLAPAAQAPGGITTQNSSATAEPEVTPEGGAKVFCEVMAFNETWIILRPEDSINTTLVALNLDDKGAAAVRGFLIGSALALLREYHLDGLRLDAVFSLVDDGPRHFLVELAEAVAALEGPRRLLIAEEFV
jgi:hypothetical protein